MNLKPHGGEAALEVYESPHDTFDSRKHRNWLVNGAGLGAYAHGRVHQDVGKILVGDIIHKRGHNSPDDILLMEEQALFSMGETLSVPTRLGNLKALAMLPTMDTANGEGDLIAYYERGVVAFNTYEAPRETRLNPDGSVVQRGWDMKRLVNHLLNAVGAVGRYSVTVLTRDHLFRSKFGLHFLKIILGEGSFNSENTNRISQPVDPILEKDDELQGAATGYWIEGSRMFASTGMQKNASISSSSFGRGFVSFNQDVSYTRDRTPIAAWEGLWIPDYGVNGIHKFTDEGFIASDRKKNLLISKFDKDLEYDRRDEENIPIEWNFETAQFAPLGLDKRGSIGGGTLEATYASANQRVRVWIRTDRKPEWRLWSIIKPCPKNGKVRPLSSLGKPPVLYRECTWFQVKVEGIGYMENPLLDVDFAPVTGKSMKSSCAIVDEPEQDYFAINSIPQNKRWK